MIRAGLMVFAALLWSPPPVDDTLNSRLDQLDIKYKKMLDDADAVFSGAKSDAERLAAAKGKAISQADFARQFLAIAVENPGADEAVRALRATMVVGRESSSAVAAIEILRRDWALKPQIALVCSNLSASLHPDLAEPLLREILAKNPDRVCQGLACFWLANLLQSASDVPSVYGTQPDARPRLERILGKERIAALLDGEAERCLNEALDLYKTVLAKYADVPQFPEIPTAKRKISELAAKRLASFEDIVPGKVAPEFTGTFLDGSPHKLSDYRGSVVLVIFWASWCGPCIQDFPNENRISGTLKGKPFVLLGVNCDRTIESARECVDKHQVTWNSFFDGRPSDGPIAKAYRASNLPLSVVIDKSGVIRYVGLRGDSLEQAIHTLLD